MLPGVILMAISLFSFMIAAPRSYASVGPVAHGRVAAARVLPRGVDQRTYALMLAQIPLDEAATKIELTDAKPGAGHGGFFGTEVYQAQHLLIVRWHGAVPADIARLVRRLEGKIQIRIVPARYSLAVLERAISQAKRADPAVTGGYPLTDGSGLHLFVRAAGMQTAASVIRVRLGIPAVAAPSGTVTLQSTPTCTPNPNVNKGPGSRCWDLPAFWGGDVIISQYGFGCTGGFGVHDANGGLYLMTAAHCSESPSGTFSNGVYFRNGNNTASVGNITDVPGPHDGAVIPTSAGNRYYDGPGVINGGDSTFTKHVVGQLVTSVNDLLCESGSYGGVLCNMKVSALGASLPDRPWNDLALATSLSGTFTMFGDSGGPWFSLAGSGNVNAQGIHEGIYTDPDRVTHEVFTPISVLSNDMGVWVNT